MTMIETKELTWQATAAANLLEARKKNGRLGVRKTRTGCFECKARHVRCDGLQPQCNRCIRSGRFCEYRSSPEAKTKRNFLVGIQLSQALGLEENDRRTFDYFLSWAAPRVAGSLDQDFWCGDVLKIAHVEPSIRDALLAISILYEHPQYLVSFHNRTTASEAIPDKPIRNGMPEPTSIAKPKMNHSHSLALKYYNRSLQALMAKITAGTATPLLALTSCILFICIEVVRDNVFAALTLFREGARLLRYVCQFSNHSSSTFLPGQLYTTEALCDCLLCLSGMGKRCGLRRILDALTTNRNMDSAIHKDENSIVEYCKLKLARLNALAAIYGHTEEIEPHISPEFVQTMDFKSLADARTALFELLPKCYTLANDEQMHATDQSSDGGCGTSIANILLSPRPRDEPDIGVTRIFYGCNDAASPAATSAAIFNGSDSPRAHESRIISTDRSHPDQRLQLEEQLQQWHSAFEEISGEDGTSYLLSMYYHTTVIYLSAKTAPHETAYDQHTIRFQEIVRLGEKYIKQASESINFVFESGVIPPLYFTSTKCRVPSLRRRAVLLIKQAPKKEPLFGAASVAEFVSRIIAIEEEGLCSQLGSPSSCILDDSILPPESSRIHYFEIIANRPAGRHDIRVTRFRSCGMSVQDYPI